jgi:hypothetical protein
MRKLMKKLLIILLFNINLYAQTEIKTISIKLELTPVVRYSYVYNIFPMDTFKIVNPKYDWQWEIILRTNPELIDSVKNFDKWSSWHICMLLKRYPQYCYYFKPSQLGLYDKEELYKRQPSLYLWLFTKVELK